MREREGEIIVIGAGPVGLTMACELLRHGARARLVDQRPTRSVHSKALVITPRTLEMLDLMGLADAFVGAGNRLHRVTAHAQHEVLASVAFDLLGSPYPFALCLPQAETERLLEERLVQLGGRVERGVTFTGLDASPRSVRVTLRGADGIAETVTADWVIGCDGAHSAVRHATGASFRGSAYEDSFVIADVRVDDGVPMDEVNFYLAEDGAAGFVPFGGGRARVVATEQSAPDGSAPVPTLAEFQELVMRRTGIRAPLRDLEWSSRFRVSRRKVGRLRHGRVFLAGDAAHIHSPAGGQGMNTGMQDAFNLAWKMALVAQERAPESLLDSYDAEREPVAETVLRLTDRATQVALSRNHALQALRNYLVPFIASFHGAQEKLLQGLSELAVDYSRSPIVQQHGHGPIAAGARLPDGELVEVSTGRRRRIFDLLREPRHTLLLFYRGSDEAQPSALAGMAREVFGEIATPWLVIPQNQAAVPPAPGIMRDESGLVWKRL
ncbi:MAG TPA: FAD-dependent monooxygenase, partial [Opitutaceae bacterium]|nr:FAD-dependent monooxygenase [Opitutaceae bacterium]